MADGDLQHIPAAVAGGLGGATSSSAQFIGNKLETFSAFLLAGSYNEAGTVFSSFLIAAVALSVIGGVVGHFYQAKSKNRWTIFLAGAAATAIGTMALPGLKPLFRISDLSPISIALAADEYDCKPKPTLSSEVRSFFNLDDKRFRVVVGSFKRPEDANELAGRVNAEASDLKAFVGAPQPCNPYYAVVVSPYLPEAEARVYLERAMKLKSVSSAFLSAYPNR